MIGDQCLIFQGKELTEVQVNMAVKSKEILR